jgi:tripartite-type tricarboxylate transporter receptor subunit TctC
LLTGLAAGMPNAVFAQGNTSKVLVGFQAGGGFDSIARIVADRLKGGLSGVVIVENKPGAAGRLAVEAVKNAQPDGATLLVTPSPVLTLAPHTAVKINFDPLRDLAVVARLASFDYGFAVSAATGITSLKQYIEAVRKNRQLGAYGTPGAGLTPHFVGMILSREAKLEMLHVPYKGTAPALQDVMGNQVPAVCATAPALVAAHRSGRIRVLATTGVRRNPDLSDVPTFAEAGFPSLTLEDWAVMAAPASTPKATIDRLNKLVLAALAEPKLQEQFRQQGFYPSGLSPDEAGMLLKSDYESWRGIVRQVGFRETE